MSATAVAGPVYDVDFADPAINRDPYPYLAEAREVGAAVYNPPSGWWMATSYQWAREALGKEVLFGPQSQLYDDLFGARVFEAMEQPDHDIYRAIWKPHFLRAAVEEHAWLVEQVVDAALDKLLDQLEGGNVVDIVPGFTGVIPAHVVAMMIGVPREDFPQFEVWNRDITGVLLVKSNDQTPEAAAIMERAAAANTALRAYFKELIADRRSTNSNNDLTGIMAHTTLDLDEEQRRAHLVQLIWAGADTTTAHLSHTMVTLAQHPEQRRALAEDRSLVPQAMEESLRYQAVANAMPRIVRDDTEFGDVTLPAGSVLVGMIAGANRDPARWDDPDSFDILRPQKAHLGYGTGIHSCIGVHLARLEGRAFLNKLLDRLPEWQLATDDLDYGTNILSRRPMSVPITL